MPIAMFLLILVAFAPLFIGVARAAVALACYVYGHRWEVDEGSNRARCLDCPKVSFIEVEARCACTHDWYDHVKVEGRRSCARVGCPCQEFRP